MRAFKPKSKDAQLLEAARMDDLLLVDQLLHSSVIDDIAKAAARKIVRKEPRRRCDVQDPVSGFTALHYGALHGHCEIVALLLKKYKASTNIVDKNGSSPLHLAAWAGHTRIVQLFLTHNNCASQINVKDSDDATALHYASRYRHTDVVRLLLEYGANPRLRNRQQETPLDLAAEFGGVDEVNEILKSDTELVESYRNLRISGEMPRSTPIHAASRNGHVDVVDALINAGFPVSIVSTSGTALHEALKGGKVEVVRRLLEGGIDLTLRDPQRGFSALQFLREEGRLPLTPVARQIGTLVQEYCSHMTRRDHDVHRDEPSIDEAPGHVVDGSNSDSETRPPFPSAIGLSVHAQWADRVCDAIFNANGAGQPEWTPADDEVYKQSSSEVGATDEMFLHDHVNCVNTPRSVVGPPFSSGSSSRWPESSLVASRPVDILVATRL